MNGIFPAPRPLLVLLGFLSAPGLHAQLADLIAKRQLSLDGVVEAELLLLDPEGELTIADNARVKGDIRVARGGNSVGDGRSAAASVKKNLSARPGTLEGDLRDSDTLVLPKVSGPKSPRGSKNVHVKGNDQVSFNGARDITIENANAPLALAPGEYGALTVDSSQLILGVAGADLPARYDFSSIDLLRRSQITLAGPVIVTVDHLGALNATFGRDDLPGWLDVRVVQGTIELPTRAAIYGSVFAPASQVALANGATVEGWLAADAVSVAQNGKFKARKVDWDPASHPSRQPTFPQSAVLVQTRLARLHELLAGHYNLAATYDADVPTVTLRELPERRGERIGAKDISIFFDTFCALLAGSFAREARLVVRKLQGSELSGHQIVDVAMTRRSFEDHLKSLSNAPSPGECVREIQGSLGLQNVFMLWSLSGGPAGAAR